MTKRKARKLNLWFITISSSSSKSSLRNSEAATTALQIFTYETLSLSLSLLVFADFLLFRSSSNFGIIYIFRRAHNGLSLSLSVCCCLTPLVVEVTVVAGSSFVRRSCACLSSHTFIVLLLSHLSGHLSLTTVCFNSTDIPGNLNRFATAGKTRNLKVAIKNTTLSLVFVLFSCCVLFMCKNRLQNWNWLC